MGLFLGPLKIAFRMTINLIIKLQWLVKNWHITAYRTVVTDLKPPLNARMMVEMETIKLSKVVVLLNFYVADVATSPFRTTTARYSPLMKAVHEY